MFDVNDDYIVLRFAEWLAVEIGVLLGLIPLKLFLYCL